MKKEPKGNDTHITNKDLINALLLISETTKTLALEVMLLPKEKKQKGGDRDGTEPNNS